MRTNVVIDDKLMAEALQLSGLPTKRAVIEEALRKLIQLKKQEGLLALRGKVRWEGDLDEMRQGRFLTEAVQLAESSADYRNETTIDPN